VIEEQLEAAVTARGGVVHWARDAAEANAIVLDLVRAKAEGREIVEHEVAEPAAKVDDLMAALEASLAAATKQATAKKAPAATKKPRRAAAPKAS